LLLVVLLADLWHALLLLDFYLFVLTNVNGVLQKKTARLQQVCLLLLQYMVDGLLCGLYLGGEIELTCHVLPLRIVGEHAQQPAVI
jgi:hypothetical protein